MEEESITLDEGLERKFHEVALSMASVRNLLLPYVVAAVLSASLLASSAPVALAAAWFGLFAIFIAYRTHLTRRYFSTEPQRSQVEVDRWLKTMSVLASLFGGLWVLLLFISFPFASQEIKFFWTFVIAVSNGFAAAAMSSRQFYPFMFLTMPTLAIVWILWGGALGLMMAATLAALGLLYATVSRRQGRSTTSRVSLAVRNERLALQLSRQNEALKQSNRSKNALLAAASHDLRQPVHALGMLVDLMASASQSEQKGVLERVAHCVDTLSDRLTQLVDFNRLDRGLYEPRLALVDIDPLVREVSEGFLVQAAHRGLALSAKGPAVAVMTDRALLRRVLVNILGNAIRFTRRGSVTCEWWMGNEGVVLEVRDTGVGIPAHRLERIFSEYAHFEDGPDMEQGLGLGLSLVQKACGALGHTLWVQSEPGVGTTFRLSLGAHVPVPQPVPALAVDVEALYGLDVAVVEDDPVVLASLEDTLCLWGCRPVAGADGAEVLAKLDACGAVPRLLISDFHLSTPKDGIHVIRQLRKRYSQHLAAILITGDLGFDVESRARADGIVVVHKPLRPAKLQALMVSLIS